MTKEEIKSLIEKLSKEVKYNTKAIEHIIDNVNDENKAKLVVIIFVKVSYISGLIIEISKLRDQYVQSFICATINELPTYNKQNDIILSDSEKIVNIR